MIATPSTIDDFPALQMVRTGRVVRALGKLTLVVLVVSIIAMIFVPWRQTARGRGTVVALDPQERSQSVTSQTKGVVDWIRDGLREGSEVTKGELLIELKPFASNAVLLIENQIQILESQLATARNSVKVAEDNLENQKIVAADTEKQVKQELEAAREKLNQTKKKRDNLEADLLNKRNTYRIDKDLFPQGLVSKEALYKSEQQVQAALAKVQEAEAEIKEQQAAVKAKENQVDAKLGEIAIKIREMKDKINAAQVKADSIEKEIQMTKEKEGELKRLKITAPRTGLIQDLRVREASDTIKEGDLLFTIVPKTEQLAVEMKVSGNDMPLIHEGDRVRLQFEGWPAVQFVGWPSVAVGTFGGKVNRIFPTDDGRGFFKVIVTPDNHFEREDGWPDDRYLRQGVSANGWVLLKRVPLGYEIWRQLNGFPPVVSEDEPKSSKDKGSKVKLPKI